ncbi:hypothetical protein [Oceanobacillus sp. CAU 1775]
MYTKIFQEIVEIMHTDYAGLIDKVIWRNSKPYEKEYQNLNVKKN